MKIRNIDFRAKASVFLLIAAGTLFQSCQQDGVDEWTDGEDELVPIEVQAGITGDVVATRATTYEKLPENSTIGIFCMKANNYDLVEDVKYTNSSGTWQPADKNRVIYVGAETAKLCAYYCPSGVTFNEGGRGATSVTMKSQPYEGNDLCYATNTTADVWKGSPEASFKMKHPYARMTFILIRDLGYVGDCKVTNFCLGTKGGTFNFYVKRYLDISTGYGSTGLLASKLEWDMASNGWSDLANNGIPTGIENSKKIDLLLIPQNLSIDANLRVQLTVDGQVLSVDIPYDRLSKLGMGIHNIITLTLKNTSLELGSVETQNWTEVKVGSGDYEIK